jgi:hypothetical protein
MRLRCHAEHPQPYAAGMHRPVSAVALAVPVVVLVLAGCGSSGHPAAAPVSAPAAASAAAPAASTEDRVSAWYDSTGRRMLARLADALTMTSRADEAAAGGDLSAASSACRHLSSAVTAAESATAVPDRAAAKWFTRALARFQQSAADCRAGVAGDDIALVNEGSAAMTVGSRDLTHATKAISALDG